MKPKLFFLKTLKVLVGIVVAIVALLFAGTWAVNNSKVQNRLMQRATKALSEHFQTHISMDSISVQFFQPSLRFYGLTVEDQQQRKMLQAQRLEAQLDVTDLLSRHIVARSVKVEGLDALLLKGDSTQQPNYQFLIDAFKKDRRPTTGQKKEPFRLDIDHVQLSHIHVLMDREEFRLGKGEYRRKNRGRHTLTIDSLNYKTDNHQPRKNTGKPHRGFFDKGHLDLVAHLRMDIDSVAADTLKGRIVNASVSDPTTGFDVSELNADIRAAHNRIHLLNLSLRQKSTTLQTNALHITLPNKREGRKLMLSSQKISGSVLPKDIARAFAPALQNFSIPLNVQSGLEVGQEGIRLKNIRITTSDHLLDISAWGNLTHLTKAEKEQLNLHFHVNHMLARGNIKERIINQFAVKKLMMNQLHQLGNLRYQGDFYILWKRLRFLGTLQTAPGSIQIDFSIDNRTKYINGQASTVGFHLGQALEVEKVGDVSCKASFKVDISKPRTRKLRRESGGKLPIGNVKARIDDFTYNKKHLRAVNVDIESNGSEAIGSVEKQAFLGQLYSRFSYTCTENSNEVKMLKTGIHFNKHSEDSTRRKRPLLGKLFGRKKP